MLEVESFIARHGGAQGAILRYLHAWLTEECELIPKIRYRIPFYYRHSWICYLNPRPGGRIEMVMLRGNELSNEQGLLNAKGRTQVSGIEFGHVNEIDLPLLREVLQEAILLDEIVPYASKRKKT